MKRLIIAEKPSVARAIAAQLQTIDAKQKGKIICENDVIVSWCFGHLFELEEPDYYIKQKGTTTKESSDGKYYWSFNDLPVLPEQWKLKVANGKNEQKKILFELIKQAEEIVHAGDPDREGQLLIDEVIEEAGATNKTILRYWANAVDDKSVTKALAELKDNANYQGLSNAAKARSRADWLVGMNLSRAVSLQYNKRGYTLSVGRVQTPTLKIVYDRDQAIKNFKSKDFFNINAEFKILQDKVYIGKFIPDDTQAGLDEENRLIDENIAKSIIEACGNQTGTITNYKNEPKKLSQPLGLSLAELQSIASAKYGFSAKKVLDLAQALYEQKYTSYPRTDCQYLPENQYEESQYVIESISKALPTLHDIAKNVDLTIRSKIWNAEKTTAHHGIVPTTNSSVNALTGDEAKLYEIIARNYIAQFYAVHEYNSVSFETTVKDYKFISKGKEVTVLGWKSVYSEVEEDEQEPTLPVVNTNDNAICHKCTIEKAQTKPPKHFTEGTLIKAMENVYKYVDDPELKKELKDGDGIGTSATRASIIETLKARNYLTTEKKYIVSTDLAAEFLNFITKEIQSPIMTALYERDLTAIAQGRKSIDEFMSNCIDFVENEVVKARINVRVEENTVKEMDITCPFCGKHIIQDNYSYKCQNENCFKLKKTTNANDRILEQELLNIFAGNSKEFTFKSKEGKLFKAKLALDKENKKVIFAYVKKEVAASSEFKCKKCGKPLVRRLAKDKKSYWWGCSGYPECKEIYYDDNGKPKY